MKNAINPLPNKPLFLHVCSTGLLKTLWEKEKGLNRMFHKIFHRFQDLSHCLKLIWFFVRE